MKNSKLALLLAVGIASIPHPIAAFPAKVIFDSALLVANTVSSVGFLGDYKTKNWRHDSRWNNLKYAGVGVTVFVYYYTISELYKAYQKSKHEQDNITVKTAHA